MMLLFKKPLLTEQINNPEQQYLSSASPKVNLIKKKTLVHIDSLKRLQTEPEETRTRSPLQREYIFNVVPKSRLRSIENNQTQVSPLKDRSPI